MGIASGIVKNAKDLYEEAQLRERNFIWKMHHREMGELTHMGEPSILSETPAQPRMPSPCLGEHNQYVCENFLGMSEQEYDKLLIEGAFGLW